MFVSLMEHTCSFSQFCNANRSDQHTTCAAIHTDIYTAQIYFNCKDKGRISPLILPDVVTPHFILFGSRKCPIK